MKYKCTADMHLWGWVDFKEAIHGNIISYDIYENIINSITYEIDGLINKKICKEFGVDYIKIS